MLGTFASFLVRIIFIYIILISRFANSISPENERLFSEKPLKSNKPSPEQLSRVYDVLADTLPKLFIQVMDYSIYDTNIIFEDHIRNIRTV